MKTKMKRKQIYLIALFAFSISAISCKKNFQGDEQLKSLSSGGTFVNDDLTKSKIEQLKYQQTYDLPPHNGIVLSKDLLTTAVNGFTQNGINYPMDSSNFDKWDFMVVYPGLDNSSQPTAVVYFYKGELDEKGKLVPAGDPVTSVNFPGGGGGEGFGAGNAPPPN